MLCSYFLFWLIPSTSTVLFSPMQTYLDEVRRKFKRYASRLVEKSTLKERSAVAGVPVSSRSKHDHRHEKRSRGSTETNNFPDQQPHERSHKSASEEQKVRSDGKQAISPSDYLSKIKRKLFSSAADATRSAEAEQIVTAFGLRTPTKQSPEAKHSDCKTVTQSQVQMTVVVSEDEAEPRRRESISSAQTISSSTDDLCSPNVSPSKSISPSLSTRSDNKSYQSEFETHVTQIIVKTEEFHAAAAPKRRLTKLPTTSTERRRIVELSPASSKGDSPTATPAHRRPQMSFEHALIQSDLSQCKATPKPRTASPSAAPAGTTSRVVRKFGDKSFKVPPEALTDEKLFSACIQLSRTFDWLNEAESDAEDVSDDERLSVTDETAASDVARSKTRTRNVCVRLAGGNEEPVTETATVVGQIRSVGERVEAPSEPGNANEVIGAVSRVETTEEPPRPMRFRARPKRSCCGTKSVDSGTREHSVEGCEEQKPLPVITISDESFEALPRERVRRRRRKKSPTDLKITIKGNKIVKKSRPLFRFRLVHPQRSSSAQTVAQRAPSDDQRIYSSYVQLTANDPIVLEHMRRLQELEQSDEFASPAYEEINTYSTVPEAAAPVFEQIVPPMTTTHSSSEAAIQNPAGQRFTNFIYSNGMIVSGCMATNPFESPCTTFGGLTPNYAPNAPMCFAYMQPTPPYDSPSGNLQPPPPTPFDPSSLINMQPTPPYEPQPTGTEAMTILSVEHLPRLQPEMAQKICDQLVNGIHANYANVVSHMDASATPLQEIQADDLFKVLGTDSDDGANLLLDKTVNDDIDLYINKHHGGHGPTAGAESFYGNSQPFGASAASTSQQSVSSILSGVVRTKASLKQIDGPLPSTVAELADFNRISESLSMKMLRTDNPLLNNGSQSSPETLLNHSPRMSSAVHGSPTGAKSKSCELGITFTTPSKQSNIQFEVESIIDEVFMNETDDGQIEKFCLALETDGLEKLQ